MKKKLERRINLRFTEQEYKRLMKEKSKTHLSLSEYMRRIICDKDISIKSKDEIRRFDFFLFHYSKFGNNINQIAKVLNTQLKSEKELHLSKSERDSIAILQEIIKNWENILNKNSMEDYKKEI